MKTEGIPYKRMIYICTNVDAKNGRPACGLQGGLDICEAVKQEVKSRGLKGKIRALKSGCMDLCEKGPNVLVFPEQVLHSGVTDNDIPALIKKYL